MSKDYEYCVQSSETFIEIAATRLMLNRLSSAEFVPNYGERYRNGEKIASGFVESAINQVVSKRMVKKQQMGWSQRGAHLLLQIRTRVLDEEWENTFRRWYPDFRPRAQAKKAA